MLRKHYTEKEYKKKEKRSIKRGIKTENTDLCMPVVALLPYRDQKHNLHKQTNHATSKKVVLNLL